MSVLDKIDAATLPRRTVEIILDAAVEDEWRSLREQLPTAADEDVRAAMAAENDGQTASLARPATTKIATRMEELRETAAASRVYFVFEPLDWRKRVALQAENPPREGNRIDSMQGYNLDTYTPAVIRDSCVGVSETEGGELTPVPEEKWLKLLGDPDNDIKGTMNYGQVNRLFGAAHQVNEGLSQVPTSARSLLETQDSGASLAQPSPGTESAPSDSEAGSQPTSPPTSTTTTEDSSAA